MAGAAQAGRTRRDASRGPAGPAQVGARQFSKAKAERAHTWRLSRKLGRLVSGITVEKPREAPCHCGRKDRSEELSEAHLADLCLEGKH
jgi:hypothetical protein